MSTVNEEVRQAAEGEWIGPVQMRRVLGLAADASDTALLALTRIERAAKSYCCSDDSDADGILGDILRFAHEGIVAFGLSVKQLDKPSRGAE